MMIQVKTILIPSDTDVEQHPSHLRSKATSVANKVYISTRLKDITPKLDNLIVSFLKISTIKLLLIYTL